MLWPHYLTGLAQYLAENWVYDISSPREMKTGETSASSNPEVILRIPDSFLLILLGLYSWKIFDLLQEV
jgi:hypothetical protein